jgi:hypothetical protein
MKASLLLTILAFFTITYTFSQEKILTKQSKISEVIAFEKEINRKVKYTFPNVTLSKDYYPLADKYKLAHPISFIRLSDQYLPLYTEYFFTPEDKIIRVVLYDWERDSYGNLFDKPKIWKEESKKLDFYKAEYNRIKKITISQLGEPTNADLDVKPIKDDEETYLTQSTKWETDDLHAELSLIFASNTYRIRLKLYWKK